MHVATKDFVQKETNQMDLYKILLIFLMQRLFVSNILVKGVNQCTKCGKKHNVLHPHITSKFSKAERRNAPYGFVCPRFTLLIFV